jgi:hypothetical protein
LSNFYLKNELVAEVEKANTRQRQGDVTQRGLAMRIAITLLRLDQRDVEKEEAPVPPGPPLFR